MNYWCTIVGPKETNVDEAAILRKEKEGQGIVFLSYLYDKKLATINKL